jgi:hypothetical protein
MNEISVPTLDLTYTQWAMLVYTATTIQHHSCLSSAHATAFSLLFFAIKFNIMKYRFAFICMINEEFVIIPSNKKWWIRLGSSIMGRGPVSQGPACRAQDVGKPWNDLS